MTKCMHTGLWNSESFQNRVQEFMQHVGVTQRRTTLRAEYKGVWILQSLEETSQHRHRFPAFWSDYFCFSSALFPSRNVGPVLEEILFNALRPVKTRSDGGILP